jgi:hypothetical protein
MANRDRPKKEFGGVFSRLQDVLAPTKLVVDKKTIEKSWKLMVTRQACEKIQETVLLNFYGNENFHRTFFPFLL